MLRLYLILSIFLLSVVQVNAQDEYPFLTGEEIIDSTLSLSYGTQLIYSHDSVMHYLGLKNPEGQRFLIHFHPNASQLILPERDKREEVWFKTLAVESEDDFEILRILKINGDKSFLSKKEIMEDSLNANRLETFKVVLEMITKLGHDTVLKNIGSIATYRCLYQISGKISDHKSLMSRSFEPEQLQTCTDTIVVHQLQLREKAQMDARSFYHGIPKTVLNEWPGLSDRFSISTQPSFWGFHAFSRQIEFTHPESKVLGFGIPPSQFLNSSATALQSFGNGQFLILDRIRITQVGNQTDWGSVHTSVLTRIKPE